MATLRASDRGARHPHHAYPSRHSQRPRRRHDQLLRRLEAGFGGHHDELADIFGARAAGAVANADLVFTTRRDAESAPEELSERLNVEVAVGITAARHEIGVEVSEALLRAAALRAGVMLHQLALGSAHVRHRRIGAIGPRGPRGGGGVVAHASPEPVTSAHAAVRVGRHRIATDNSYALGPAAACWGHAEAEASSRRGQPQAERGCADARLPSELNMR